MESDYQRYRGKCLEMSKSLVDENSCLRLVRGHYYCPQWGKQPHWWCVDDNGNIHDPTALQFPSKGNGLYVEFDGLIDCEYCGETVREEDGYIYGNHTYCSNQCCGKDVM